MTDDSDSAPRSIEQCVDAAAERAASARDDLRSVFAATTASIDSHEDRYHLRLNFEGFESYGSAVDRALEVAETLRGVERVDGVAFGVDTREFEEDDDPRPEAWVAADYE